MILKFVCMVIFLATGLILLGWSMLHRDKTIAREFYWAGFFIGLVFILVAVASTLDRVYETSTRPYHHRRP